MAIKTERFIDPFDSSSERRSAWRFGMWLFVVVVGMVFASAILGYMVVRLGEGVGAEWRPPGAPGVPRLFVMSTLLVGLISAAHVMALRAARSGTALGAGRWMMTASIGALLFLVVQVIAWWELIAANLRMDASLYAYTLFVLTGLHALHVIGGMPSLALTTHRAMQGRYRADDTVGIELSGLYWHTLAIAWIALYAVLWFGS
ncbi:MAG: heme-copper oxidase subunit III [Phycisphaeraceae bacterium]|nr:heme-copper oxidase subunit III [Phycisphaeraceae bacterium]